MQVRAPELEPHLPTETTVDHRPPTQLDGSRPFLAPRHFGQQRPDKVRVEKVREHDLCRNLRVILAVVNATISYT